MELTFNDIFNRQEDFKKQHGKTDKKSAYEKALGSIFSDEDIISDGYGQVKNFTLPNFDVEKSTAKGADKKSRDKLSQIRTFVEHYVDKFGPDTCTIIPIPVTSKANLEIWGSAASVGRAVERMVKIGIIGKFREEYRFKARCKEDNISKLYCYYSDNGAKFIEYCEREGIKKHLNKEDSGYLCTLANTCKTQHDTGKYKFEISEVCFCSNLHLEKPAEISDSDFKKHLISCLRYNYVELERYEQLVKEINEKYYSAEKDAELRLRFEPTVKLKTNKYGMRYCNSIGIRVTNSLCNLKKEERSIKLTQLGLNLNKDVKSSVPRLTLSLNNRAWVPETTDIYKLVYNDMFPNKDFTVVEREAVKDLFLKAYFEKSDATFASNNWKNMVQEGLSKNQVYDFLKSFRQSVVRVLGGHLYGSEIFYVESCAYLFVLYELLHQGRKAWLLYDCFYCSGEETLEDFRKDLENRIKEDFELFFWTFKLRRTNTLAKTE